MALLALCIIALLMGAALVAYGVSGSSSGYGYGWLLASGALLAICLKLILDSPLWGNPLEVSEEPDLNVRAAHYIGREVTVETAIHDGRGKVRVGDTLWSARGADAPAGSKVRIASVDGTVLVVEPAG